MAVRNVVKLEERRSLRVARPREAAIELPMLEGAVVTEIVCSACGETHRLMYSVGRRDRWLCSVCDERSFVAARRRRALFKTALVVAALCVLALLFASLFLGVSVTNALPIQ
ncbi:MAG TPA: hypothetical protein VIF62_23155 [Labilithrix sp.]|jgi:transposase-like protein